MARVDIHGNPVSSVGDAIELQGLVGMGDRKDSGKFVYYRLGSSGYITTGPYWAVERERREEKGDTALRKYGTFQEQDINKARYRKILQSGGAKEFPLAQVIENGWHRTPPVDKDGNLIHFPQLDNITVIDHKCGYCGKMLLGCRIDGDGNLVEDDINRRRHESVAHKEISSQEQLGRTLATALAQIGGSGGGAGADTLAIFAKLVSDMQERQKDQDKLIAELTERVAGGQIQTPAASDPPAVESVPRTMAGKRGKAKTK